jgi:CBS domain-containing protein
VFKDIQGHFKGFTHPLQIIENKLDIATLMARGDISGVHNIITVSVKDKSDKKYALNIMAEEKIDELPVIDETNNLVGILQMDKLMNGVLLDLISN